jgi:hypothetical protein
MINVHCALPAQELPGSQAALGQDNDRVGSTLLINRKMPASRPIPSFGMGWDAYLSLNSRRKFSLDLREAPREKDESTQQDDFDNEKRDETCIALQVENRHPLILD